MIHVTPFELGATMVPGPGGVSQSLEQFLVDSFTTSLLVLHHGEPVFSWSRTPEALQEPQPGYSITKSVLGVVAGSLIQDEALEPERGVITYVPELAQGGYRGVTVRDLLDMRTGGDYREAYGPDDELTQLVAARAAVPEGPFDSVRDLLCRVPRVGLHDGPFAYRSLDTEALGWVIERATGSRMDQLAHELVLQPLGCEGAVFELDGRGEVLHSGGLSLRPVDFARFGSMILGSGAIGDRQIVSPFFVKDLRAGHPCDAESGGGSYRNQFWVPVCGGRELLALGIHGQMLWMDASSDLVFLKLSDWPRPSNPELLSTTYAVARRCAAALSESDHRDITVPR
ncbi:MAG: serine hydrolase [Ornithinimicrobium sp.]